MIEGICVIDQNSYTTFVTPQMAKMLDYNVEEMLGKNIFEFMDQQGKQIAEQILERSRSGIKGEYNLDFLKKDGTHVYASLKSSPIFDEDNNYSGAIATVTDITEQIKNKEALQVERKLAQKYLDIVEVMVIALDENGQITLINKKGCNILGYNENEILGKNWFDYFIPERFKEKIKGVYYKLMDMSHENVYYYENLVLTKKGEERLISWHNTYLQDNNGNTTGILSSGEDITESSKAKKILQKTTATLLQAQKMADFGNWEWNIETNELIWSEEIFNIFGLNSSNFIPNYDDFINFVHPDDREFVNSSVNDSLKLNMPYNIEHRIIKSNGEQRFVNELGEVVRDTSGQPTYMIGTIQDITKRKKIEMSLIEAKNTLETQVEIRTIELSNEKRRIETIIETLPAGILVIDNDGQFYKSNKAFKDYIKQIFATEQPQSFKEILKLGNLFGDTISKLFSSDKNITITIEPLEGFHLEMTSSLLSDTINTPIGVVITVRDVSPFIEVDRLRQQFVSMVSHELRTPITVIDLSIKNLKNYKDKISEEQKDEIVTMIAENSYILNQMVEDLLIVSRIEAGVLELQFESIQFVKLFDDIIFQIEPKYKSKEIKISKEIKSKKPLFGDYKRISQVFRILLDNAIKYSPEKSTVSITVIENYTGIYNPKKVEGTLIQISDQGIGIDLKEQSNLFKRFFRGSNIRSAHGTGLGLSIAKEFITLHGGEIYVESQIDKGSTFSVFFPYLSDNLDKNFKSQSNLSGYS